MIDSTDRLPLSRRSVLAGLAGTAIGLGLSGCGTGGGGGTAPPTGAALDGLLPKYIPATSATPDLAGTIDVNPGYLSYPQQLASGSRGVPGAGGRFTVMANTFGLTPPPGNSYYQAVNKALGAEVTIDAVPADNMSARIATVFASKQLPDAITFQSWALPSDLSQAAPALLADLAPYLSGDKVAAYPNLANLPTSDWSGSVFANGLYAIPCCGSRFGPVNFYRKDLFDAAGLGEPTTAEEWLSVAQELTDADQRRWGSGDPIYFVQQVFGVPSDWRLDGDQLVNRCETEEFVAALDFAKRFYDAGVVHPDMVAGGATSEQKQLFASGRLAMYSDGFGAWPGLWSYAADSGVEDYYVQGMKPFAHDGGTPIGYADGGAVYYTSLSKSLDEARITEFLRIADFLAAPFGTKEYELVSFGVEGTDFTRNDQGTPIATDRGKEQVAFFGDTIIIPPVALFSGDYPQYARDAHTWQTRMAEVQVTSPVFGLHPAIPPRLASLEQRISDAMASYVRGRTTSAQLQETVTQWRTSGGDELRKIYLDAIASER